MQNYKLKLFLSFCLLSLVMISCKTVKKNKEVECDSSTQTFVAEYNSLCDSLPTMRFIDVSLAVKTNADIPTDKPILLVLFNPTCGHCEEFCKQVKADLSSLNDATVLFITGEPNAGSIGKFSEKMQLDSINNFIVAADNLGFTKDYFEYQGIPQIMVYDKKHRLRHIFYKEADMKDVLPYLLK